MRRQAIRISLILLLLISSSPRTTDSASASEHFAALNEIYFPWVPNGAMLGSSGPFYGSLTIQNLEEESIAVYPVPLAEMNGSEPPMVVPWTLNGLASTTLSLEQLGLDEGVEGTGVVVRALRVRDGAPARIAGVQKQAAPEPPTGNARTSDVHTTVGGYSALAETSIGDRHIVPIVQTNSGWNTTIRVTNFDETLTSNTVRVALREAGGGSASTVFTEVLGVGETGTFDLLGRGVEPGWVGSAEVTGDGDIGAIAERAKSETNMLIINTSRQYPSNEHSFNRGFAPLILREWNFWNTGISLVNLSENENKITVDYYAMDGSFVDNTELVLAPGEMNFIYTPASVSSSDAESEGFVGAAVIDGEHPFHGAADQVKYFGDDQDTGHAMSYMLEPPAVGSDRYLIMPLVQKGNPQTGLGDTTGIQLFNYSASSQAMVEIWFLDQLGNLVGDEPTVVTLGGLEGHTAYTMFEDQLPTGFQGTALIKILGGQVTAAANNVNYSVQYDGSSSHNLFTPAAVLRPHEVLIEANPNPVPHFLTDSTLSIVVNDAYGRPLNRQIDLLIGPASVAGFTGSPAGDLPSSRSALTSFGEANPVVRIRDSALNDRPVMAAVGVSVPIPGGALENQVDITWNAPPVLQPTEFEVE